MLIGRSARESLAYLALVDAQKQKKTGFNEGVANE